MGLTPSLAKDYQGWLDHFGETKEASVAARARQILPLVSHYKNVAAQTGVPAVWLAAVMERESGSRLNTYLGNGDPLNRVTRHVPRGRGPFLSWDAGAIDALHLDGMDNVKDLPGGWRPIQALYQWEKWNGFGYRNHGRRTPYVVGATSLQQPGRYAGDGNWSPSEWDTQYGTLPIAVELIKLDPSLDLNPSLLEAVGVNKPFDNDNHPPAANTPDVFVPGTVLWVQHKLNLSKGADGQPLLEVPLVEDGIYGRQTSRAVRAFQTLHPPLLVDGIPGELTMDAMKEEA